MSAVPPAAAILDLEMELAGDDAKACCAAVYANPAVRWLLADELHPGGEAGTLRALELAGVRTGDRLLDVASGNGASALLAAGQLGCEVVGVEYGEEAVAQATSLAAAQRCGPDVRFVAGDAESLPFADGEFDAVLCECSLCTFSDKSAAVAEMFRVLRPGGRLALSDAVVDHDRLPAELRGPLGTIACVGDALTDAGYRDLLGVVGFQLTETEDRRDDASALAGRVLDRLRGARILGVDQIEGSPLSLTDAIALVRMAQDAIDAGTLGYTIYAATR